MHLPRNKLKKVPLPFSRVQLGPVETKLDAIVWNCFRRMGNDTFPINTAQRKNWGEFLSKRGIVWEIRLKQAPIWEGWETVKGEKGVVARPKNIEDYIKINHYFVPKDLAIKILALGELL